MEALGVMWVLLRLLLALALLAFGLYCCYIKYIHVKYDHIPSAPRESFFFGHLPVFWRKLKNKELIHDLLLDWAAEYGPIVRFNAFHRVSLLVLSPEGVKEYLMLPQYPKDRLVYGSLYNMFGVRFLGNGLITDRDYTHWHKHRRIMDPAFSRRIDYCNALHVGLPLSLMRKLQLVQNTAARLVMDMPWHCHMTPVLHTLHWLPVDFRARFKVLVLTFKALHGLGPAYLRDHLCRVIPQRAQRSTYKNQLRVPGPKEVWLVATRQRTFSATAPALWNTVPADLRREEDLLRFRGGCKTWLFEQAF